MSISSSQNRQRGGKTALGLAALTSALFALTAQPIPLVRGATRDLSDFSSNIAADLEPLLEHQEAGRYHKASAGYFEMIEGGLPRRDAVRVRERLAECLEAIGFHLSAAHVYFEALRLGSGQPEYPHLMEAWVGHASRLAGHPVYAAMAVTELPEHEDPLDLEALRLLRGLAAFKAGDDGGALVAFEDIAEDPQLVVRARFLLGVLYARQDLAAQAQGAFAQALTRLSQLEEITGDLQQIRVLCQLNLARLSYGAGDLARARAGYNGAAEAGAHLPSVHRELAWALLRADRPEEAWALAAPIVDEPVWPPDARLLLALSYQRTGQKRLARALTDTFRDEVKAHQTQLGAWLDRFPRRRAEEAAAAFWALSQQPSEASEGEGAAEPMLPLPAGLVAQMQADWRLRGAAEQVQAAEAERRFLARQMPWWQERSLGENLPEVVEEIERRTRRQAGLFILDTLDRELSALDRLAVDALLMKKGRGTSELGPLAEWEGAALPDWPPPAPTPQPDPDKRGEGSEG